MPDDLGPLEELAVADHPVEGVLVDEEVVDPVDLARPRCARGDRDGERETLGIAGDELADDAALADPGGPGDDEERPGADGRLTS
jgi:hypothetical protein